MVKRFQCGHEMVVKTRTRSGFMNVNIVCPRCRFKEVPGVVDIKFSNYLEMRIGTKIVKLEFKERKKERT